MEEIDIRILKWMITNRLYIDTHKECDYHEIYTALENLLKDYEQNKKIIHEMAENIYGSDTIFCLPKDVNSKQEVIDYFKKRCNNE